MLSGMSFFLPGAKSKKPIISAPPSPEHVSKVEQVCEFLVALPIVKMQDNPQYAAENLALMSVKMIDQHMRFRGKPDLHAVRPAKQISVGIPGQFKSNDDLRMYYEWISRTIRELQCTTSDQQITVCLQKLLALLVSRRETLSYTSINDLSVVTLDQG